MATTFRQAAGKAAWRTLCIINLLATYWAWHSALHNIRLGKADPMALVIGRTTLAIWVMVEITALGYIILWIEHKARKASSC